VGGRSRRMAFGGGEKSYKITVKPGAAIPSVDDVESFSTWRLSDSDGFSLLLDDGRRRQSGASSREDATGGRADTAKRRFRCDDAQLASPPRLRLASASGDYAGDLETDSSRVGRINKSWASKSERKRCRRAKRRFSKGPRHGEQGGPWAQRRVDRGSSLPAYAKNRRGGPSRVW